MIGNSGILAGRAGRRAPDRAGPRSRRRLVIAATVSGCALALFGLFYAYVQLSRSFPTNSDGAGIALQAWQALHGNPLLRGWVLSDVPFYTTELPQYMLVELVRGLNADVVHVAAGMTYALALLGAALLATGRGTGWGAALGACTAAVIMLDPQGGFGLAVLLSSPDHIGTSVPIMLAWLILDRVRTGWPTVAAVSVVLAWAAVGDALVTYVAIVPLVLVVTVRLGHALVTDRGVPWRRTVANRRHEIVLAVFAVVAAVAARLVLRLISGAGGFRSSAPSPAVSTLHRILWHNVPVVGRGLLLLFGADFIDYPVNAFVVLHLVGVLLVVVGIVITGWRFFADRDLVAQLLLAGIVVNLAIFLVTRIVWLPAMHEVNAVLPFGAALAGRQLGPRIARPLTAGSWGLSRFAAAGLLVTVGFTAAGYTADLVRRITPPVPPTAEQRLAAWLAARHLYDGLSGYWTANTVTLTSKDTVRIGLLYANWRGLVVPGALEEDTAWNDPAANTADFVVLTAGPTYYTGFSDRAAVVATFGQPVRTYDVPGYQILVWPHTNLLTRFKPANGLAARARGEMCAASQPASARSSCQLPRSMSR